MHLTNGIGERRDLVEAREQHITSHNIRIITGLRAHRISTAVHWLQGVLPNLRLAIQRHPDAPVLGVDDNVGTAIQRLNVIRIGHALPSLQPPAKILPLGDAR